MPEYRMPLMFDLLPSDLKEPEPIYPFIEPFYCRPANIEEALYWGNVQGFAKMIELLLISDPVIAKEHIKKWFDSGMTLKELRRCRVDQKFIEEVNYLI